MTAPASDSAATLLVIAKQPVPGRVKTRELAAVLSEADSILGETA